MAQGRRKAVRYHGFLWRSGRVAEGGALLRRYGAEWLHRGFESLLLRWRGGRAVECGGLENRYPSLGGSRVQIPPPPLSRPFFAERSAVSACLVGKALSAEVRSNGLHESRHTFASLMIAAGSNAKALSTYMGHSSITITLDRYGHLMPGNETEAAACSTPT